MAHYRCRILVFHDLLAAAVMINPQFFFFHGNLVCNPFRRPVVKKEGVREREVTRWKEKKKWKKEKFLSDL